MKKLFLTLAVFGFAIEVANAQTKQKTTNPDKLIGVNLIKNSGAENVTSSNKPVDWKVNSEKDDFAAYYGYISGEWDYDCGRKCGLPENAGDYYFRAPADIENGQNYKSLEQSIDIAQLKDTLAKKEINFIFSAQIAGFHCNEDLKCAFGYLKIEFFDGSNQSLKVFEVKKYTNEFHRMDDSENGDSRMHKFEIISLTNKIPVNAIRAVITIGSTQNCQKDTETSCAAAYVFFDNLNLVFSKSIKRQ